MTNNSTTNNIMQNLELYLNKHKELSNDIYEKYANFNYPTYELFKLHLDFLLDTTYNIKITTKKRKRLNQTKFRKKILKKFNYSCIITNETCVDELTASHIVPVKEKEDYDIDNGLLLRENLHKTFDNYKWSINPNTMRVEIKKNVNVGQIKEYENKEILIDFNNKLYKNLMHHYQNFIKMKK